MEQMRLWLAATLMAACTGGQTGSPTDSSDDIDGGVQCPSSPDAATALGVTGLQLWDEFAGEYTFSANGSIFRNNMATWLNPSTFEVTVARTDENVAGLTACTEVSVPVRVFVRRTAPALDVSVLGSLSGSLRSAVVAFRADGGGPNIDPHFQGGIIFNKGEPGTFDLYTDEFTHWVWLPPETR